MATITLKQRTLDVHFEPKRKKSRVTIFVMNYYAIILFLTFTIMLTAFLYLSTFNDLSSQGVIINELEAKRSELIIENEVWNMRIAQLKSLDVIERQQVVKRMPQVDPAEIEFVNLSSSSTPEPCCPAK